MKNLVLSTPERRILYLSETVEGSYSEKRLADEEGLVFGPAIAPAAIEAQASSLAAEEVMELLVDLGFAGYAPQGASVVRPHKKPRRGELSCEQKAENRSKAQERVVAQGTRSQG